MNLAAHRKSAVLTATELIDKIARFTRYPRIRALLRPALNALPVNRFRDAAIVGAHEKLGADLQVAGPAQPSPGLRALQILHAVDNMQG